MKVLTIVFMTVALVLFFALIGKIDGGSHPNLPENREPEPARSGPGTADLSEFVPATDYSLPWDKSKSSYTFVTGEKQVITCSGQSLAFYYHPLYGNMVRFAKEGEICINAGSGNHDYFVKR